MYEKHKYEGKDLEKIEKAFRKIAKEYPLYKAFTRYNLQHELAAINAECDLVCAMYKLNDFRASCYAYAFTMRKIEEIITYCYKRMAVPRIMEWCNSFSDFTKTTNKDGSVHKYSNLGYIYDHLRYQQMAIAGRYFIEYNIEYLERDKPNKDYPSRKRILEAAVWWINQGLLGRFGLKMPFADKQYDFIPQVVIFSTFPSSGKSYLVNTTNEMFVELNYIINKMGGFLRVGNEQGNIFRQSRQTMALIENKDIFNIYPENRDFIIKGSYRPFAKSSEEEWGLSGVKYDPATSIFKTRDSAINSVRCVIASMDDPSRGQQESTNVKIHNDIVQLYRGDFSDRFKSQDDKFIILTGTMFNPNDVFSLEIQEALDGAHEDKRFKNTYINKDKKTIVIVNDCEDEYGNSAYPEFISTEELNKKREGLDPYDYACVWRQKPIPADGLIFSYDYLKQYDELDETKLDNYSVAYVDPTRRRAKDYFAMPICRYNNTNDNYMFYDCIFERKSSIDLYDAVIDKIISDKIVKIYIEENIDGSLAEVIKEKLKHRNIPWCEVLTKYNVVNKAQRIASMASTVKNAIEFPKKGKFPPKHPVSLFMRQLTDYSADSTNRFDDAADSICGFADNFIINGIRKNTIKSAKRLPY